MRVAGQEEADQQPGLDEDEAEHDAVDGSRRQPAEVGREVGRARPGPARTGRSLGLPAWTRSASGRGRATGRTTRGYDPELLEHGDRRNVVDRYRYWRREAVVADLDPRRHDFHVAIENWQHDFNIGSVVRTANAFLAREVHIVGQPAVEPARRDGHRPLPARAPPRRRRGVRRAGRRAESLPVVGIDNLPGSVPLESTRLPRACVLLFGQEGPGLSRGGARGGLAGRVGRAVRLDPVDQRRRGRRHRHAHLGPPARPGHPL